MVTLNKKLLLVSQRTSSIKTNASRDGKKHKFYMLDFLKKNHA